jgi:acetyl esterase/lipase
VRRLLRIVRATAGAFLGVLARVLVADRWLTPRPTLVLLRRRFDRGPITAPADLPVRVLRDLPLGTGDRTEDRFDLVLPADGGPHPLVVWLHGGGGVFGSRHDVLPYAAHLADRGYAVAALDYPLAPQSRYPGALVHLNAALPRLLEAVTPHGLAPEGLVLAGSSAGANLAAQLGVLMTSPEYAGLVGLAPGLPAGRLHGLLLHGGIYDIARMDDYAGFFGRLMRQSAWAYTGDRRWVRSARTRLMSPVHHVTEKFPPTFLSGGTHDPFTANQMVPMAGRLRELGVDVEVLELDAGAPDTGHDFQYDLADPSAVRALERSIAFLDRVAGDGARPERVGRT